MQPWLRDDAVLSGDVPCTHALVIGVSRYDNLPDDAAAAPAPGVRTFGLRQLRSAAASGWAFANWLKGSYANTAAPLGTVRMLLAPSQDEEAQVPGLAGRGPDVLEPTAAEVGKALVAWRDDCCARPGNVAILYVAGHGIMLSKDEGGIVLLKDFGAPGTTMLAGSLDVPSVRRGLAGPTAAQTQFYFIDACQVRPEEVKDMQELRGGIGLDAPAEAPPAVSAVYSSAAPGTLALGAPGRGTLFSQALLECLDALGTELDDDGKWVVRDTSLVGPLKARVLELATEHGLDQAATGGGTLGPTVLHRLASPPMLDVKFAVDPSEAAAVSFVSLSDEAGNAALQSQPVDPELAAQVPAGLYTLEVAIDPDTPPYTAKRQACFVRPPRPKPVVVTVT